ncbi:DNA-binding transcriptional response regulator [Tsukamurella soli]|uniref:Response regulator n=1 Tax=Tsukamurella soli TaxID=644556 RepID=A0ABP8JWP8_9ACTN
MASLDDAGGFQVLAYSSHAGHRAEIVRALGTHPAPDVEVTVTETATAATVISILDHKGADLVILDGEAAPVGGMGLARQLRDEIDPCPPLLVVTARAADAWLARWSRADAAVARPLDPFELAETAVRLLRERHPGPAHGPNSAIATPSGTSDL